MRHQKTRHKLSRSASHRKALLANLCVEVIDHERIKTTEAKAKAVKPEVEKLITLAKRGDHHARRQALSALGQDKFTVYKLFEVIFEPGYQRRTELFESSNFLETADHAFEFVAEHDPAALEIHRSHGAAQETVWNYSASRAAAVNADRKELVETFGFDPTAWGK